jgi:hypothetical protein
LTIRCGFGNVVRLNASSLRLGAAFAEAALSHFWIRHYINFPLIDVLKIRFQLRGASVSVAQIRHRNPAMFRYRSRVYPPQSL